MSFWQILKSIFEKKENESIHNLIFFICLCIFVIGLPTSRFLVSISQILMAINWLAEGKYHEKIKRFWDNKPAVFLSSIYLVYIAGMLWTHDLSYGFGFDLKNKLPIFSLTFLIASSTSLNQERTKALLVIFSLSVIFSSLVGLSIFLTHDVFDPRNLSPFMIHIYLSMMVLLTIFLLPWITKQITDKPKFYYLSLLSCVWLSIFFVLLSSLTVFFCLFGVLIFLALRETFYKSNIIKKIIIYSVLLIVVAVSITTIIIVTNPLLKSIDPDPNSLGEVTKEGNSYVHYTHFDSRENGHLVFYFIAEDELREAWNERSKLDFNGKDITGQELRRTVLRYMTSKGLRKDKEGLSLLNDYEIRYIENGIPNYLYKKWPNALVRIHQTFWELQEYQRTDNPIGYTLAQRLELWKASTIAFYKYPVFGWGTGDVSHAIEYGLTSMNSRLKNYEMKPHNQVLNILLMSGIAGLILISVLYAVFMAKAKPYRHLPYNIFLIIFLISMISTNPIDNQMGLSFFLFFSLYFGVMYKCDNLQM